MKIDLFLYRQRGALGVATHCSKHYKTFDGYECFGVAETATGKHGEWVVVNANCASVATPTSLDGGTEITFAPTGAKPELWQVAHKR